MLSGYDGLVEIARSPEPKPGQATSIAPSRSSTKRWRRASETGHRPYEAELNRVRGEMLLKRDPANLRPPRKPSRPPSPSPSGKPRAVSNCARALSLAKLYQSTARPADGHAVLAPALEGFSPTPEMPEIAEAQALLAALTPE